MVMAVIVPQFGHNAAGLTSRIRAGMFVSCPMVTVMPASEVGKLLPAADDGCFSVPPTPFAKIVMTWPGATVIGAGNRYPAPIIVFGVELWPRAETAKAAKPRIMRCEGRIIRQSFRFRMTHVTPN